MGHPSCHEESTIRSFSPGEMRCTEERKPADAVPALPARRSKDAAAARAFTP
jgi:hypothetical protein